MSENMSEAGRVPMPGDAVRLTGEWPGGNDLVKVGAVGVIGGVVGQPQAELDVCFNASAFRGKMHGRLDKGPEMVSTSGGPCVFVAASCLTPTVETMPVNVWRWRDWPMAGGDERYSVVVPVWEWNGQ